MNNAVYREKYQGSLIDSKIPDLESLHPLLSENGLLWVACVPTSRQSSAGIWYFGPGIVYINSPSATATLTLRQKNDDTVVMDSKILPEKSLYQSLLSKINPDIFTDTVMLGELHGHDWGWVFYPRQNKIVPIEEYRK